MRGSTTLSTLLGSRLEVPFFRPAVDAGMSYDALTVGKPHSRLERIRPRAVARRVPFEEVTATELVVMAILGLRGSMEAPETLRRYVRGETRWASDMSSKLPPCQWFSFRRSRGRRQTA
jgi:hypothetical protein